ncbi:hypothetical protein GF339_20120 [candidate division KSB3 bacterium]|uniref:Sigma-54 factor interaction domain-containing protein n=1 Tax=candidate division KSB3 bacterium TaxID=2044937 RepID=A0A9D5K009_9BACT|nr:hypothetical protein [candidate division KSB3 bacterium]MBD3326902.1 hypothetical protein [candidate division KSB3 bacterium]
MDNLLEKVIYHSDVMQQVRRETGPLIDSAAPLLFWGETGSGMGFYARAMHEASPRTGKFLRIPSFTLDEESVKQQFMGVDDQPGWLEETDNGMIFLKRVSEISPAIQQTLLQLMSNQSVDGRIQFTRKGRTENLEMNVRFIYSVAHDFSIAMQDELLRRDFVDELKKRGRVIHIPPLRERKEDIIDIARNFFDPFNEKHQQHITTIDPDAQHLLTNYIWPGNIDELKRVIEGIFTNYPGITTITAAHIPDYIKNPEITGDKYSFKLKDDVKFTGKILSPLLKIQTDTKKLSLNTRDLIEIVRVEDATFAPPKFKHFIFKFKNGDQITGKILDKKMNVETSFDPVYQVNPQDICSIYLA